MSFSLNLICEITWEQKVNIKPYADRISPVSNTLSYSHTGGYLGKSGNLKILKKQNGENELFLEQMTQVKEGNMAATQTSGFGIAIFLCSAHILEPHW